METFFLLIDYELDSRPGLHFQETPQDFTLRDVFEQLAHGDTTGKVRGIYQAIPGQPFKDWTGYVANALGDRDDLLSECEREFLDYVRSCHPVLQAAE